MSNGSDLDFFAESLPPGSFVRVVTPQYLVNRLTGPRSTLRDRRNRLYLAVYKDNDAGASTEYYDHKTRLLRSHHRRVIICSAGAVEENVIPAKEHFREELLKLAKPPARHVSKSKPSTLQPPMKPDPFNLHVTTSLTKNRVQILCGLLRARKDKSITISISREKPSKRRFYYTIFGDSILMARLSLPQTMAHKPVYVLVYSRSVVAFIGRYFESYTGTCSTHISGDEADAIQKLKLEWRRFQKKKSVR